MLINFCSNVLENSPVAELYLYYVFRHAILGSGVSPDDIEHGFLRGEWLSCRGRGQEEVSYIVWTILTMVY